MATRPLAVADSTLNTLRVGLSGCGQRGDEVVRAVRTHRHCDVIALHDPDQAQLQRLGDAASIDLRFTDYESLLATGVDFVVLCGPAGDRAPQVEAAAAQGVHCCVHAPMAITAADASRMVAACEAAEVKLGVVVPAQADPTLEQIRRMIADDWLGSPVLVTAQVGDDRVLRSPPPQGHWLRDPLRAGRGALMQLATEQLHLAVWLTERPAMSTTAQVTAGFTQLGEDSAAATLLLRGGVVCTFAASHLCSGSAFAVHGTDGAVRMAWDRTWLRGRKAVRGEVFDYPTPHVDMMLPRGDLDDPAAAAYELHGRFARWIDDRDDFPCPGDQAAADLQAVFAMQRAIAGDRGEPVQP